MAAVVAAIESRRSYERFARDTRYVNYMRVITRVPGQKLLMPLPRNSHISRVIAATTATNKRSS